MPLLSNIDYITLIQVLFIFFAGGVVKGLIGVGLPTVSLTLLSFLFDIKDSISIILIPVILTNFYQMLDGKNMRLILSETKLFLIFSVIFIVPGFFVLRILDSNVILFILASLLILNSSIALLNYELKFKNHQSSFLQISIGAMTGMTTGITSIYTMPFIFLIQSLNYSKDKVIQLMGICFFLFSITQLILFSSADMIDVNKISLSLTACVPILVGVVIGTKLRKRIGENMFKKLFNLMLILMGSLLIAKLFI